MQRILLVLEDFNELMYLQTILKKVGFDVEGVSQAKKFDNTLLSFNPAVVVIAAKIGKVGGLELAGRIKKNNEFPKVALLKNPSLNIPHPPVEDGVIDIILDAPVNIHLLLVGLASCLGMDEAQLLEKYNKLNVRPDAEEIKPSSGTANSPTASDDVTLIKTPGTEPEKAEIISGLKEKDAIQIISGGHQDSSDVIIQDRDVNHEFDISIDSEESLDESESIPEFKLKEEEDVVSTPRKKQPDLVSLEDALKRSDRNKAFLEKMEPVEDSHFVRDRILEFNKWIRSQQPPDDLQKIEADRKEFVRRLFNKK